ncbi:GDSL-type esterase/lipase family protein [uncultured Campylobacter sp.]|uniref:GDSL-type esterase/lipase family protein n=1 Tax=uncultured Campylobacter sp. TaxID=218934 RepID=UPI00260A1783|nr:GDSL-type esterase/lipase family protein [uncultured Campylobacter sp.]
MRKILLFLLTLFVSACVYIGVDESHKQKKVKGSIKDLVQTSIQDGSAIRSYARHQDIILLKSKIDSENFVMRIFGDSHMAADFFSRELRSKFIEVNSIGYIYPLQPKYQQILTVSYESKDFELFNSKSNTNFSYAMGGILAESKKEGAFIKIASNLKEQNFNIKVFYKAKNKGFVLSDENKRNYALKKKGDKKFSSIELKNVKFPIQIKALEKNAQIGGLLIYKDGYDIKFLDTLGINGARSDIWLRWDKDTMKEVFKTVKSDFIILAYGSNDAFLSSFDKNYFKKTYKDFIKFLRQNNKYVNIMLISPPTVTQKVDDENYELSPNFYAVREAIYEIAKEERLMLFDMHNFMQESGGKDLWIEQGLSLKDVHLSIDGYKLMADKFQKDLKAFLATF